MKKLKEQYKGLIITKKHMILGDVTFNSNTVTPDKFQNFINLGCGFEILFEDEQIEIIEEKEEGIGIKTISYEGVTDEKPKKTTKKKS
jgi:hypothetical protein